MVAVAIIGLSIIAGVGLWMVITSESELWPLYLVLGTIGLAMTIPLFFIKTDTQQAAYDQGQVDALAGQQTFEAFYVYPKGDTIPSDTLYLPIRD